MTETATRRIEYRPLRSLHKNERNPKNHDVALIDDSMSRFGYVEPVVLDERTDKLISGHGRTETLAAKEARGDDPPEGVQLDPDGAWLVPVVVGWSSADDAEAEGVLVALNQVGVLAGFDQRKLADVLDVLNGTGSGLRGSGFDTDDLARILRETDAYGDAAAGFLGGAGDEGDDPDPDQDEPQPEPAADLFQLNYTVTREEREQIMVAIKHAKDNLGASRDNPVSSATALAALCVWWMEGD